MPDAPDDYNLQPSSTFNVLADDAELAVRLGSSVLYNRSGNCIFICDMTKSLNPLIIFDNGSGSSWAVTTETSYQSGVCAKFIVSANLFGVTIRKDLTIPLITSTGIEIFINYGQQNVILLLTISAGYDGIQYYGELKFDSTDGSLYYINSDNLTYTKFGKIRIANRSANLWTSFKLVIDPINNQYVCAIVGNKLFPLDFIPLGGGASILGDFTITQLRIINLESNPCVYFVDNYIITINEP